MDRIPPLVGELAPHDHERGDEHDDEQRRADRRGDDPRVGRGGRGPEVDAQRRRRRAADRRRRRARGRRLREREPVPVLLEPVHAVLLRVAPDRADDVGEDQVDHRVARPAVPDRQPVEADDPLEERQPREQQDDDQRQIPGEERREAAHSEQEVVERVPVVADLVAVAAGERDPEDEREVPEHEDPERRRRSRACAPRGGAGTRRDLPGRQAPDCGVELLMASAYPARAAAGGTAKHSSGPGGRPDAAKMQQE